MNEGERFKNKKICSDEIDNDCDTFIDEDDSDCPAYCGNNIIGGNEQENFVAFCF